MLAAPLVQSNKDLRLCNKIKQELAVADEGTRFSALLIDIVFGNYFSSYNSNDLLTG